jgi:hypothetical protein
VRNTSSKEAVNFASWSRIRKRIRRPFSSTARFLACWVDGRIRFREEPGSQLQQVIISVKACHVAPAHVRELRGVVDREKATIGVLITMRKPSDQMQREASMADPYVSVYWGSKHRGIQLLTAEQIIKGRIVDYPRTDRLPAALRFEVEAALAGAETPAEPKMREVDTSGVARVET